MTSHADIATWLEARTGRHFAAEPIARIGGGEIGRCLRWAASVGADAFVKLAPAEDLRMLQAEAMGLRELTDAGSLRIPALLGTGRAGDHAVLALEWLDLRAATTVDREVESRLGERLAMQHRVTAREFGWHCDNALGSTLQPNGWAADWVRFFTERRLGHQLTLAEGDGLDRRVIERGRELCARCGAFFSSYRPVPSLLHGDLWGGNWAVSGQPGEPVIFDPAVYYGDRETDLAMTRLFGGFGPRFYAAYQAAWPLDQAAGTRRTLYNLYHVLNHSHLFGGAYARQAASMIDQLLAEFD